MQSQQVFSPPPSKNVEYFYISECHESLYIKTKRSHQVCERNLDSMSTNWADPQQLPNGIWRFHVFLQYDSLPRVPIFSTYIFSKDKWFEPNLCFSSPSDDGDCQYARYKLELLFDINPHLWDKHTGYFSNFRLCITSYQHFDPYTGEPHRMIGISTDSESAPGHRRRSRYLMPLNDEEKFGFSASITERLSMSGYKLYFSRYNGDYVEVDKSLSDHVESDYNEMIQQQSLEASASDPALVPSIDTPKQEVKEEKKEEEEQVKKEEKKDDLLITITSSWDYNPRYFPTTFELKYYTDDSKK